MLNQGITPEYFATTMVVGVRNTDPAKRQPSDAWGSEPIPSFKDELPRFLELVGLDPSKSYYPYPRPKITETFSEISGDAPRF